MMTAAMGKQIVVFLDYDGTLAPIVDDPERAFMSDAVTPLHIYDMWLSTVFLHILNFIYIYICADALSITWSS